MGPTSKPDGVSSIGKAAHITAAAPGGPRYDAAMSAQERSAVTNAIWLCSNCADMIDRDPDRYPIDVLKAWRKEAESLAQAEQGKKLPSQRELAVFKAKAMGENITSASVAELMAGVHSVSLQEIERIDPRFRAKIRLDHEGVTHVSLNPRETVHGNLRIPIEAAAEFSEKLDNLQKHGHSLMMDVPGIMLEGSPLFRESPKKLVMESTLRRKAIQRLNWTDVSSGKPRNAEFIGELVGGTESITFSGNLFGGLYQVSYQVPWGPRLVNVKTQSNIAFSSWDGQSVRRLPFLDAFYSLCEAIFNGQQIGTSIEVDGQEFGSMTSLSLMTREEAEDMLAVLDYLTKLRDILVALDTDIKFQPSTLSSEDARHVNEVWYWLCHMPTLRGAQLGISVGVTIVPEIEGVTALKDGLRKKTPVSFKVEHGLGGPLHALGQIVPLSGVTVILTQVVPRVQGGSRSIKAGKPARLQLMPTDDCTAQAFVHEVPSELATA